MFCATGVFFCNVSCNVSIRQLCFVFFNKVPASICGLYSRYSTFFLIFFFMYYRECQMWNAIDVYCYIYWVCNALRQLWIAAFSFNWPILHYTDRTLLFDIWFRGLKFVFLISFLLKVTFSLFLFRFVLLQGHRRIIGLIIFALLIKKDFLFCTVGNREMSTKSVIVTYFFSG